MARSNKATILAANTAIIVNGNLDAISDYFASDYTAHVSGQDFASGHDVVATVVRACRRAFPRIEIAIDILVTAKNRIAWQRTLTGEQTGPFKGFPATGRRIVWRDMITTQFRNGLIAEEWVVTDLAEQLLLARKR